ncbi:protein of unknown function [Candidatus Methylacidiphilum fumarolicum]|uniref:Uncharacterized protein n=1 Tax=Candidatus Methylacidiphilum fumarolicum TaxID=591154 RepID=A0ABM9IAB5_9BACT|nr:protein of unknown function [Candidatus Methylacidiphilum fumarolicum]
MSSTSIGNPKTEEVGEAVGRTLSPSPFTTTSGSVTELPTEASVHFSDGPPVPIGIALQSVPFPVERKIRRTVSTLHGQS